MCGIHGFCWKDTERTMSRMTHAAAHRGPDGRGVWGNDHITLGHNLLAISDDKEVSKQPWLLGDSVLVFNGEIYNYRELSSRFQIETRTESDTEVLAAGLVSQGPEFLEHVDGMFALAFYSSTTQELLLARDSNGSKPFYYGFLNGKLAFSSEISSLLELGFDRKVSREGFRHYYHSGLVAGPLTMFEGIRRLLPGQVVRVKVDTGAWTTSNLNDKPPTPLILKQGKYGPMVAAGLRKAVEMTLMGRRKTGLLLSGGMDSSAVLHETAEGLGLTPNTFTTRFVLPHDKCPHNGDADMASFLAKRYGSAHQEVLVTEADWIDFLPAAVRALEEPRQGKSYPAYYATLQAMKASGVIVVLSGDGGDELLMGYKHQREPPFRNKLAALRAGHRELHDPRLAMSLDEQEEYLNDWLPRGGLTGDAINDFMYTECLHTLSEDFLLRNDKLGMAFSMEARFPMMGRPFRDLARSIPSALKLVPEDRRGHRTWDQVNKFLLRQAYVRKLPPRVTGKVKTGWRAPTDEWLVGRPSYPAKAHGLMRTYFRSVLADPVIRELFEITDSDIENRYLNNREFRGPLKPSGKPMAGPGLMSQKELFTVIMFAVWFKLFKMQLW
jgi:asparagine synthase (glutamine-hydrolysing)